MKIALTFFALTLFLLYSLYFVKIIKGSPEIFEKELLGGLANWMLEKGAKSQSHIWQMFLFSFLLEANYFLLVFLTIDNYFMLVFAVLFAAFELFHLFTLGFSLRGFFQGKKVLKEVFNWKVERCSALFFFTYSLLLLVNLYWL